MVLGPATSQFHKGPFWKGRKERDYRQKIFVNCIKFWGTLQNPSPNPTLTKSWHTFVRVACWDRDSFYIKSCVFCFLIVWIEMNSPSCPGKTFFISQTIWNCPQWEKLPFPALPKMPFLWFNVSNFPICDNYSNW